MNRLTDKERNIEIQEEIMEESKARTTNGNRVISDSDKLGGAQRGGPGQTHAKREQPPDATRPKKPSQ